jgi:predicted AAA+ superfamily ATPase
MVFPDAPYANLESPSTLALCREDPNGFLGGMLSKGRPAVVDEAQRYPELYESYVATYLERDVRQLSAVQDLATFHRFLQLCAARVGQLLNKANLSVEAGISQATVERWLSVLEASHVIFRLQPYFQNLSKRLVKTPKLYFCDAGLVCHLVGIRRPQELELHPLRGALLENLVFSEFLKRSFNSGTRPSILFFRDKTGHEVDFLIADGDRLRAFEVKSSATFRRGYVSDLRYVRDLIGPRLAEAHLLYVGAEDASVNGIRVRNAIRYFMAEA